MRRALVLALSLGLLASVSVGCAEARDQLGELVGRADERREETGSGEGPDAFCLALTRAATAIASGSPATAQEAAEEALARAPEELVDDSRVLVEALRDVRDDPAAGLGDPELTAAAGRLADSAGNVC